jgi:hypothetical protein
MCQITFRVAFTPATGIVSATAKYMQVSSGTSMEFQIPPEHLGGDINLGDIDPNNPELMGEYKLVVSLTDVNGQTAESAPATFFIGNCHGKTLTVTNLVNGATTSYDIYFTADFPLTSLTSQVSMDGTTWTNDYQLPSVSSPQKIQITVPFRFIRLVDLNQGVATDSPPYAYMMP